MLNWLFLALIGGAVLTAAFTGTMPKVTEASMGSAKSAVELALGLIGQMTLWLGFMGVLREAGLLASLSRGLTPVMRRLFPDVPPDHPAMGAMILNVSANILGLGNAATPFGLKAMKELDALNRQRGVATNAMALFLVINTSGVAVLPLGVVGVRAALGSKDPAGVIVPSIIGTFLSTVLAVLVAKVLEKLPLFSVERAGAGPLEVLAPRAVDERALKEADALASEVRRTSPARLAVVVAVGLTLMWALVHRTCAPLAVTEAGGFDAVFRTAFQCMGPAQVSTFELGRQVMSDWLLPVLMLGIVMIGFGRDVKVYEAFITAAKEGFQVATVIIPFLVAILVAIGMFRASGAMEAITSFVGPVTSAVGIPAQALPMALIRPLSGSGALAVMTETMKTYGADSFVGYLVSLINGSSETTFYVLALYFGSVQVRAVRHTLAACLISDALGLAVTVALCHLFFGGAPTVLAP